MPARLYFPELDGLRFVAFLLVFIHHLPVPDAWHSGGGALATLFTWLHDAGWIGVDIFFALSAYLLTRLALREHALTGQFALRAFYYRRALRIWPLYFFALLLGLVLYPWLMASLSGTAWPDARSIASLRDHALPYGLFLGNLSYAAMPESLGIYRSLWTVSLEEQFYLVFPLLMLGIFHFSPRRLLLALGVGLAIAWATRLGLLLADIRYPWIWVFPLSRLDPLLLGMALGVVAHRQPITLSPFAARLLGVGILLAFMLIAAMPLLGKSDHTLWQLGLSGVLSVACLLVVQQGPLQRLLSLSWVRYLGKISFGLYVYHRYGLDLLQRAHKAYPWLDQPGSWSLAALGALAFTVAVSALSYRWLERPFLQWKERFTPVPSRPV